MKQMKAVVQYAYGSIKNLTVAEVDRPVAGPGEVLVKVRAASVHPDIWHVVCAFPRVLRFMGAGLLRPKNPIPGTDMAGVVEAVGPGVTRLKVGDEVFGETIGNMQWIHGGAFAEYVAVAENNLAIKPTNVSFEQAASVPTSGYIVHLNLDQGRAVAPGMSVLVNGAGGGVGSVALQMIKALGATVTAVDCGAKLEMVRTLGADEVIDYEITDFTQQETTYDIVFDIPGNHAVKKILGTIKPGGRYIPIGHDDFGKNGKATLGSIPYMLGLAVRSKFNKKLPRMDIKMPDKESTMERLRTLLESGQLTPIVDHCFPLEQVQQAMHKMSRGNPHGKVMITQ